MGDDHSSGTSVTGRLARPTRMTVWKRTGAKRVSPLFGLAPGEVYRAVSVTSDAVRSYRTLSPLPGFHITPGGLLSVALSRGSPPPGVTRHRVSMEPGLSSPQSRNFERRPSGHLALIISNLSGLTVKGFGHQVIRSRRLWSKLFVSLSASPSIRSWRK